MNKIKNLVIYCLFLASVIFVGYFMCTYTWSPEDGKYIKIDELIQKYENVQK